MKVYMKCGIMLYKISRINEIVLFSPTERSLAVSMLIPIIVPYEWAHDAKHLHRSLANRAIAASSRYWAAINSRSFRARTPSCAYPPHRTCSAQRHCALNGFCSEAPVRLPEITTIPNEQNGHPPPPLAVHQTRNVLLPPTSRPSVFSFLARIYRWTFDN